MRIKFLRHYVGIQPGTITEEKNPLALKKLLDGTPEDGPYVVQGPDTTPTTEELEKRAAKKDKD